MAITKTTDKSQTKHRRLETSHRRVTDNYRRVTDDYKQISDIRLSDRLLQATRTTEVYFQSLTCSRVFIWIFRILKPSIGNVVFRSFIFICKIQKHLDVFWKKGVLKNFAEFTGKYLCRSLFFLIKLQAWGM